MIDSTARDLIERMANECDRYWQLLKNDRSERHSLATEARAYLAAELQADPQKDWPTHEQLYEMADDYYGDPIPSMWAALARWGRLVPPAGEGSAED